MGSMIELAASDGQRLTAYRVESPGPAHTVHIYPADHGFNCDQRGSYDEAAAKLARGRTLAFFRQHVG